MRKSRSTMHFVPNPGFAAALARSTMFEDDMARIAEEIAETAQANAPESSGDFKDGIESTYGDGYARVNMKDWKSVFIEFGTSEHPFGAPLRKAIESLGFRLRSS